MEGSLCYPLPTTSKLTSTVLSHPLFRGEAAAPMLVMDVPLLHTEKAAILGVTDV